MSLYSDVEEKAGCTIVIDILWLEISFVEYLVITVLVIVLKSTAGF